MGNMTLAIPDDVQVRMKRFSEVRWSEVARKAIIEKMDLLERAEQIGRKSKLSKADALFLDKKIKVSATKRFHADNRP